MTRKLLFLIVPMPLFTTAAPLSAQSQTVRSCATVAFDAEASGTECEIIVTGTLPTPLADATNNIISVTPDGAPSARLERSLGAIASLQQFRRSDARTANPTSQGVTLRGLGGNASSRALLILDGVPQADPFGGWIAWPGYDSVRLSEIAVRRGGGSVADGAGALAGTIDLVSDTGIIALRGRDFADSDYFDAAISVSNRTDVAAKASTRQKLGAGTIGISASYTRGDGFIPIIASQRGAVDRKAPYEQMGIALRGVAPLSGDTELQASLRGFTDKRDRGFDFSDNRNSGVDASIRLVNRILGGWQWSALGYVQIRDFASRFGSISTDRSSVVPVLDQYSVPSTGLGARFELRPPVGDKAELRIGADWRRTIGETGEDFFFTGLVPGRSRRAGGETDTLGAFVEASIEPSDGLILTAGGRLDRWTIANGFRKEVNIGGTVRSDDVFADRSGWEGTGRAAFAYQFSDVVTLRGAGYAGWRLPTLNELYRPFRVGADATAANELLAPERLKGGEIGVDIESGGFALTTTAFWNRLDNAVANVSLGSGPGNFPGVGFVAAGGVYRQRQNLDAIDSKGIEVDASYAVGDVNIRAGYAYVDAEVRATGAAAGLDGLRPAQVPKHFASVGFGYEAGAFDANLDARYVGGQFEDDGNVRRLRSAFTLDGGLSYKLGERFQLELRGENLFDARVEAAISGDGVIERAAPRTIWAGIRVEL